LGRGDDRTSRAFSLIDFVRRVHSQVSTLYAQLIECGVVVLALADGRSNDGDVRELPSMLGCSVITGNAYWHHSLYLLNTTVNTAIPESSVGFHYVE